VGEKRESIGGGSKGSQRTKNFGEPQITMNFLRREVSKKVIDNCKIASANRMPSRRVQSKGESRRREKMFSPKIIGNRKNAAGSQLGGEALEN